jgi:hypothetical protein
MQRFLSVYQREPVSQMAQQGLRQLRDFVVLGPRWVPVPLPRRLKHDGPERACQAGPTGTTQHPSGISPAHLRNVR